MLPMAASQFFVMIGILLIGYWLVFISPKIAMFPTTYNVFFCFMVVHALVTYGLVHADEFSFGIDAASEIDETTVAIDQERGRLVLRFFFNAVFAYALAAAIRTRRDFLLVSVALGVGFCFMMALSDRSSISRGEDILRLTGGFLNPNDLGHTAMVVAVFNSLVVVDTRAGRILRIAGAASLGVGIWGVVASASRSAMAGLIVVLVVVIYYSSFRTMIRFLFGGLLVTAIIGILLSSVVMEAVALRVSIDTVRDTQGSMRIDILTDYLQHLTDYAILGVGLARSIEVTKDSYTTWIPLIPHNAYLQTLVEWGCGGLLLFVLSLRSLLGRLTHCLKRPAPPCDAIVVGLLVSWCVIFLVVSWGARIFWVAWALMGTYGYLNSEEATCRHL
ncbi:MAG: O-antigen ligase family protein [Pseudomonadota bacterium]